MRDAQGRSKSRARLLNDSGLARQNQKIGINLSHFGDRLIEKCSDYTHLGVLLIAEIQKNFAIELG